MGLVALAHSIAYAAGTAAARWTAQPAVDPGSGEC